MTETPLKQPASDAAITDFGIDTTSRTTSEAIGDYFRRLRGGELGALPALLGLLVLVLVFTGLSDSFLTLNNIANLFAQGGGQTIIAMGIVPVLLLGEIDLSAGTASGVAASVLALHFTQHGNLLGAMGSTMFYGFVVGSVVAIVLCVLMRIWIGAGLAAIAALIFLLGIPANPWVEMLLAVCVGAVIGSLTGALVSKIGIPAFVVTLALFIAWYGVVLALVGQGGTIPIRDSNVLFEVANGNLNVLGSWILFVVAGGGYAAVVLFRHYSRLRHGLVAQPTTLIVIKAGAVVVLGAVATYLLNLNRSPNPNLTTIQGVPYVIPIILVLLVVGTFVLDRTRYGRHVYAVGGNKEAARRAGVKVDKIRMSVFVICSSVAAIGAIVYSSKVGSVDGNAGNGNTLLFAVGAAVIGGTSLFGGRGRIRDAVIGGLVLATVQNGLGLLGYQADTVNIITGLVLLIAATVDALSRKRAAAR
ncbi:ABC transporter permease [Amycolatopsis sp. K13G38]|uniref:Xylose transport system permease protein XylH n=1 Tax=Amycolatopsis acididurans TaxID=2724524 RepID=A0ABX1J1T7_9PSEU|nr:ABC transporter permease [Amycolatopsis acididurans]NKQ53609.1 ABC transporter permease [Amycolatopsis acididurans]